MKWIKTTAGAWVAAVLALAVTGGAVYALSPEQKLSASIPATNVGTSYRAQLIAAPARGNPANLGTFKVSQVNASDAATGNQYYQMAAALGYVYDAADGNWDRWGSTGADTGAGLVGQVAGDVWTAEPSVSTAQSAIVDAQINGGAASSVVAVTVACGAGGAGSITVRSVWDGDCNSDNGAQSTILELTCAASEQATFAPAEPWAYTGCVDVGSNVDRYTVIRR